MICRLIWGASIESEDVTYVSYDLSFQILNNFPFARAMQGERFYLRLLWNHVRGAKANGGDAEGG